MILATYVVGYYGLMGLDEEGRAVRCKLTPKENGNGPVSQSNISQ